MTAATERAIESGGKSIDAAQPPDALAAVRARLLGDAAHRPGQLQRDLQKANEQLHQEGLLPGLQLVGVKGEDFVVADKDGKIELCDSHNLKRLKPDADPGDGPVNYQVKPGDNAYFIARDHLRAQLGHEPTGNEIMNYEKEMARLNPQIKSWNRIYPGDKLTLPAIVRGGDDTAFTAEHKQDAARAAARKEEELLKTRIKDAGQALASFGSDGMLGHAITSEQIASALKRNDLTPSQRAGLEFLQKHYAELSKHNWFGGVYAEDLARYQKEHRQAIAEPNA